MLHLFYYFLNAKGFNYMLGLNVTAIFPHRADFAWWWSCIGDILLLTEIPCLVYFILSALIAFRDPCPSSIFANGSKVGSILLYTYITMCQKYIRG